MLSQKFLCKMMTNEITKVEIVTFKMHALHINEPYVKLEKHAVLRNCGTSILILCHMLCLVSQPLL